MRRITAAAYAFALCVTISSAFAGECTNPNALGVSRTLVIDNTSHLRLGAQQYNETLPLADREVVLTFDDGPLAPYSTRVLDLLAAECVKATYFLVGTMAQHNPELVKRIQREGHTIGTHSRNHPLTFDSMPLTEAEREIDGGIALVQAALGEQGKLAPFFRIPGLLRSTPVENSLAARSLVTWSVDLVADDWHRGITAEDIATRALRRLEARGRGILLLHDIHPATALAMPKILKGLKQGGFRVVHVVPAGPGRPKTDTEPQYWAAYGKRSRVVLADGALDSRRPVPSRLSLEWKAIAEFTPAMQARRVMAAAGGGDDLRLPRSGWTDEADEETIIIPDGLSAVAEMNWPGQVRFASVSSDEANWPVPAIKTTRTAEPKKKHEAKRRLASGSKMATAAGKPAKRNATGADAVGGVDACRSARCKKQPPAVGHQLSLTRSSPDRLRPLYQF